MFIHFGLMLRAIDGLRADEQWHFRGWPLLLLGHLPRGRVVRIEGQLSQSQLRYPVLLHQWIVRLKGVHLSLLGEQLQATAVCPYDVLVLALYGRLYGLQYLLHGFRCHTLPIKKYIINYLYTVYEVNKCKNNC